MAVSSFARAIKIVVLSVAIGFLTYVSGEACYAHLTLGESHGPFGFVSIVCGFCAALLIWIWRKGPGWKRVLYVTLIFIVMFVILSVLPPFIGVVVAMVFLTIAIMWMRA